MQKFAAWLAKLFLPTFLNWLLGKGIELKDWLVLQYELKYKAPKKVEELEKSKEKDSHDEQAKKTADLFKP